MKTLYKWQKTVLKILGILTFISITFNTLGKEFNIGYFFDLAIGISINILIFWIIFKVGNWIYRKFVKKQLV